METALVISRPGKSRAAVGIAPAQAHGGRDPMTLIKKCQPAERPCIICGKPAYQTICPTCEAHVRGEAIEKKTGVEKKGRPEQGRQ